MHFNKRIRILLIIYFFVSCFEKTRKAPKIIIEKKDSGNIIESIETKFNKIFNKIFNKGHKNKDIQEMPIKKSPYNKLFYNEEIYITDKNGKKILKKRTHNNYIKKASNKKLELTKIYIMGAIPSLDKENNIIKLSKGITTYTYRIMGEFHNKGDEIITEKDNLYLETKVFFRQKGTFKHIEYKNEKSLIKNLHEFDKGNTKIKLPIKPNGGMRLFEFKIAEIPESHHKVGLFLILRDKKQIWSTHYIALHRPAAPPVKEGFFDFFKKGSSPKWWYLTLSLGIIAIIIAVIAII